MKGSFEVILDGMHYKAGAGDVVFISSVATHEIIISDSNTHVLVLSGGFSLLGEDFYQLSKYRFSTPLVHLHNTSEFRSDVASRFEQIFHCLLKEDLQQEEGFIWMIQACLFELFSLILRYVPLNKTILPKRQKRVNSFLKIQSVLEYFQTHYHEQIALNQAAELIDYEVKSFCRFFKETTDMTFHKYLNIYRIDVAIKLLQHENSTIHEIGQQVGIPEAKTFSRIFRDVTGMTPTQYRKIFNN